MATEGVSVVKATAKRYFKGASDLTFRRRLWLTLLLRYGLVQYNASGVDGTWDVEFSQPVVRQYGDAGDQEFNEHDALQQLTVDVRGYTATDRLTKKKQLMNKGVTQIYDLYKKKSDNLIKSLQDKFSAELYIDGNLAGNENRLIGIESFLAEGTVAVGDIVAQPSDSYAGQNTDLADLGGNWSTDLAAADRPNATIATDWPYGNGDVEYDFLAPKLINYSSTNWSSGKTDWIDNVEEVLRFTGIVCAALTGDDEVPYCHMLDSRLYNDFLNFYSARNRIVIPHRMAEDLGFSKTMNFEGAMVKFEFDQAGGVGHGLSPMHMELFSLQDQLFVPDGPEWSIVKKGYLYEAGFFGNLRFQPKYFAKYKAYA